jgi:hypothetical protein
MTQVCGHHTTGGGPDMNGVEMKPDLDLIIDQVARADHM